MDFYLIAAVMGMGVISTTIMRVARIMALKIRNRVGH